MIRYDSRSIRLHWLTAALVAALWLVGQGIDWWPRGDPRIAARSVHIVLGAVLALVVALRLRHRFGPDAQSPPADAGLAGAAAVVMHKALYILPIAAVGLGILTAWVRGDTVFGLFALPSFAPGDKAVRKGIEGLHELAANALLAMAMLHAAAGLLHHFVLRDGVLRRMLPGPR